MSAWVYLVAVSALLLGFDVSGSLPPGGVLVVASVSITPKLVAIVT